MKRTTLTVCHGLRLIPVDCIERYGRVGAAAGIMLKDDITAGPGEGIPGTVMVESTYNEGLYANKITYEYAEVSAGTAAAMERNRHRLFVAVYYDGACLKRISGSPDYPLSFSYVETGGVYKVTLTGTDTVPDSFLVL